MVSITSLLVFSASALASPVLQRRQIAIPEGWNWQVSKWEAGCTRSGCYYNFDVTVPSIEGEILGVKAHCIGYENGWYRKGNWYDGCDILEGANNGVAAKLSERESDIDGSPKEILISFTLAGYEDRPTYNFTAKHETIYNAAVSPQKEFEVTPTEVWGIA
ncbi:hypothetical protein DE146DRAFT_632111 [Phaeosphaeria sp. MPI-PUGE-AT-0046c]|nr:hypothetical protein DE146DRAFT_632111 [Phaeosphaeria sp. MPI-PUGE-AT-0046c]